jgi:purine nucleosidase
MPTRKLILDGDYGIDDALAALYLADQSDVDILAAGSVHGNAAAAAAARNALAVLAIGGRPGVPVAVGAAQPLAQPADIGSVVHGDDGLGGEAPDPPAGSALVETPAAVQLVETIRAHPGECTVVATGPLTNLALALLLDPQITTLVSGVVVMGGTVQHPGNVTPYAEANIANDPEAARLVFRAPWPVTQVGLDVTMATWLEQPDLARIEASDTAAGRLAWRIMQHYLGFYFGRHGRPGCPVHDPSAALIALDPSLATAWIDTPVEVELRSEFNRGMLVVDRRVFAAQERAPDARLVRVVTEVDRDRLISRFLDGLLSDADSLEVGSCAPPVSGPEWSEDSNR